MTDEEIMNHAIIQARKALELGEVPIGAVIVQNGQIIAAGCNSVITNSDPTAHAEIQAIRQAGKILGNYRLPEAELFVTIEPCVMCAGALIHSRIKRIVFGASEQRTGGISSVYSILQDGLLNHTTIITSGVLEEECRQLMQNFFRQRREEQKLAKARLKKNSEDKNE